MGDFVYSVGGDGWLSQWPKQGLNTDGNLVLASETKFFCLSPTGTDRLLVAGGIDGYLYWIDVENKSLIEFTKAHSNSVFNILQASDTELISVGGDGRLVVWNVATHKPTFSLTLSTQGLRCINVDKAANKVYVGASDNAIYVLSLDGYELIQKIDNAHLNSVFCLLRLPNGDLLSGGRDAQMILRDGNTLESKTALPAHWFTINDIILLGDTGLIASASRDKTIRIWEATDLTLLTTIDRSKDGHVNSVNRLLWNDRDQSLFSVSDDRTMKSWKITLE